VLTHMSHVFDYTTLTKALPPSVLAGYDGLTLQVAYA
jgi:hypothetical protein